MIITEAMIIAAQKYGACSEALFWLEASRRTIDDLVVFKPYFAAWALRIPGFVDLLTDEQLGHVAVCWPPVALEYAPERLSDSVFSNCVARFPWAALEYALARLSDEQLAACMRAYPALALQLATARLTPEQITFCTENIW